MKYKTLLTICLIACVLFTISSVNAIDENETIIANEDSQEIIQETNEDIVTTPLDDDILKTDDGTFISLQNKINSASSGSTITLENDYTYNEGFDTNGIKISKSITIDGNGHTLNGLSKSRIISVNDLYSISLKNIKFKNGYSENDGGAIHIESDYGPYEYPYFKIINCEFENNVANNGGAISSDISYGIIENCIFTNNIATVNGGGIYLYYGGLLQESWKILNSIFTNNNAKTGSGGGLYSQCENLKVEDSKFNNNFAKYKGGAIEITRSQSSSGGNYIGGKNSKIQTCEFNNNKADSYGGAIHIWADYCTLDSSIFKYNVAKLNGDAVYIDQSGGYTHGSISNCTSFTTGSENDNLHIASEYETQNTAVNGFKVTVVKESSSQSSSSSSSKKISKATPKLTAKKATFKVKTKTKKYSVILKTNKNKAMKKVKLYLKVNGKTFTAKTNSKGKAIFKITNLKKKKTFKATVTYKGNTNYKKVSKTIKIKCK